MAARERACAASRYWHRTETASCDHRSCPSKRLQFSASESSTSLHRIAIERTVSPASARARARSRKLPNRGRHPCWPSLFSMAFEAEIGPARSSDSDKQQHALGLGWGSQASMRIRSAATRKFPIGLRRFGATGEEARRVCRPFALDQ
jgi:hypothetical protein